MGGTKGIPITTKFLRCILCNRQTTQQEADSRKKETDESYGECAFCGYALEPVSVLIPAPRKKRNE